MQGRLAQLVEILGPDRVSDAPERLAAFTGDRSFVKPIVPDAVVQVQNVAEVRALVRWANETKTPLVPVSSGAPHHRGDAAPRVPGAVVVDLSGMKRILSIDRTNRMCVVEPGVTYPELQAALAEKGMTLPATLAPRATKSVLASCLETEPRLNALHQWCFLDPLRCVEVTWGDGNTMFTGEAGGAAMDLEKQWSENRFQIEPTGPMMLDFYRLLTGAQGTMGIATWASLKCELLPSAHVMNLVSADRLEDLVDFAYRVLRMRFSDEFLILNRAQLAMLLGADAAGMDRLRAGLPAWFALVGVAGRELLPKERVAQQTADLADLAKDCGLALRPAVGTVTGDAVLAALPGRADGRDWKEVRKGAYQDVFFTTTLDKADAFVAEMATLAAEAGYPADDVGVTLQPQNMGTSYHCEFTLPYDAAVPRETARVRALFSEASRRFSALGAYYLRPYGEWARLQLNRDAQSMETLRRLKSIFDPNGILNPGQLSNQ